MSSFDTNDLKIAINTILNRTEDLMETSHTSPIKCPTQTNILETSNSPLIQTDNKTKVHNFLNETSESALIKRPHNLQDLIKKEVLQINNLESTYEFNELDTDEEVWIMDIPVTIDPVLLKNQILQIGSKSKFKVGDDRYYAIKKNHKSSFTCIFKTNDNPRVYKAVNLKPVGTINLRKKISGISKKNLHFEKSTIVPYPQNIKIRHPLFGVQFNESIIKNEKTSDD